MFHDCLVFSLAFCSRWNQYILKYTNLQTKQLKCTRKSRLEEFSPVFQIVTFLSYFSYPPVLTTNGTPGSGLISWVVFVCWWDHFLYQRVIQLFGTMIPGKKCILYHSSVYIYTDIMHTAEKATATHSSTLAWKIPRTEEPGRLQSMGSRRVGHD